MKSKAIVCEKSLALLEDAFEKKQPQRLSARPRSLMRTSNSLRSSINGTPAMIFPTAGSFRNCDAKKIIEMIISNIR